MSTASGLASASSSNCPSSLRVFACVAMSCSVRRAQDVSGVRARAGDSPTAGALSTRPAGAPCRHDRTVPVRADGRASARGPNSPNAVRVLGELAHEPVTRHRRCRGPSLKAGLESRTGARSGAPVPASTGGSGSADGQLLRDGFGQLRASGGLQAQCVGALGEVALGDLGAQRVAGLAGLDLEGDLGGRLGLALDLLGERQRDGARLADGEGDLDRAPLGQGVRAELALAESRRRRLGRVRRRRRVVGCGAVTLNVYSRAGPALPAASIAATMKVCAPTLRFV